MLLDVLNKVRANSESCAGNETATRTQLIDPILKELGWDVTEPSRVMINSKLNDGKIPDYTLKNDRGEAILFVEAKRLNLDLNQGVSQIYSYCKKEKIQYGFLTNGCQWMLVDAFETSPQDRVVWSGDITDGIEKVAKLLSGFSYENREKFEVSFKNKKLLDDTLAMSFDEFVDTVDKLIVKLLKNVEGNNPNFNICNDALKEYIMHKISKLLEERVKEMDNKAEVKETRTFPDYVLYTRTKRNLISVTFPDGTEICESTAVDTFVETIKKIGLEDVAHSGVINKKVPVVSKESYLPDRWALYESSIKHVDGYYIMAHGDVDILCGLIIKIKNSSNLKDRLAGLTLKKI